MKGVKHRNKNYQHNKSNNLAYFKPKVQLRMSYSSSKASPMSNLSEEEKNYHNCNCEVLFLLTFCIQLNCEVILHH